MRSPLFTILLLLAVTASAAATDTPCLGSFCIPQQIHLAVAADPSASATAMSVTYSTFNRTSAPVVQYGREGGPLTSSAPAEVERFVDLGSAHRVQYVYRAVMSPLVPGDSYSYRVGDPVSGWSAVFSFVAKRAGGAAGDPMRFVVYGDMGDANAQSMASVATEVVEGRVDAIVHVGDFAYDLFTSNATVGDRFMNDIQPIAATTPYMGCPGNHEAEYVDGHATFANYRARFTFPGREETAGQYYSWDHGPVHFVSFSTELYFWDSRLAEGIPAQYEWLEADLAAANRNRAETPWIVAFAHRPMYCSNSDGVPGDDCEHLNSTTRNGIVVNGTYHYGFEDLLFSQGVDVFVAGHEHSYERLASGLYDGKILDPSREPYVNPAAPVQIISGSAGCRELFNGFRNDTPPWSAYHTDTYGYGVLTVYNETTLHWEQKNEHMEVIDEITVYAKDHGPFGTPSPRPASGPRGKWRALYGLTE